jgi:isochorismate synthase
MQTEIHLASLFKKSYSNLTDDFPFVLYKKPVEKWVRGLFQKNKETYLIEDFSEKGYVFAPFSGNEIFFIPEEKSEFLVSLFEDKFENKSAVFSLGIDETNKDFHVSLVAKGIQAIQQGHFAKVVLSRKETIDLPEFDFERIFISLTDNYPEAYVYCWYHPKTGFWFGAFSEQLLKINNGKLHTMSVAGTQNWNPEISWQEKEIQEQQFVTDFIAEELKSFSAEITLSDPYTLKAGALAHIKTDIIAALKPDADLKQIVTALHPTPAVCGLPKRAALGFILKNEGYDRSFYSGFHGELNKDFLTGNLQTDFFVNLRCMQIQMSGEKSKTALYVGGGITKDSNPEAEWLETENKLLTMKKVLF